MSSTLYFHIFYLYNYSVYFPVSGGVVIDDMVGWDSVISDNVVCVFVYAIVSSVVVSISVIVSSVVVISASLVSIFG